MALVQVFSRSFSMTKLMVDASMAKKLTGLQGSVLLCDPAGKVLGRVVPPSPYDDVVVPFTEDELRQAEEESEEYSLPQVLAELEKP
jgi:hypothetical protein